jgi:D-alanyl-D-alanine carboxypeptidase (penicillin-binding protein 5/6)
LAVFLGILANRLVNYKSEAMGLPVLEGKVAFSDDPKGFYSKTLKNVVTPDNTTLGEEFGTANQPLIAGNSALMVDLNTNKILYEKNSNQRMKIASLTKIMTAIIALEHKDYNEKIYVTRHAAYIGEDTMYLTTGEVYTLKELLYGLLLNSGNDAAYAIADGVAGDTSTFVEWMNIKAKEIGLENTEFKDPSGLDDNTYSTAQDLIKLSRYAMKHDLFREIVKTYNIELTSDTHKYVYLENATNLLTSYPGVAGVKTGYTEEAGLCLVTYASNNGHEIMGVVLKSIDRKGDMILMLDHGFGTLGVEVHHNLL